MDSPRATSRRCALRIGSAFLGLALAAKGQHEPFDAAAALQRCRLLAAGDYLRSKARAPEPGPDDVPLCLRALADDGVELRRQACHAAGALVQEEFFATLPEPQRRALVLAVLALLDSADDAVGEASAHAVGRFAARPGMFEARDARTAIVQALALVLRDDVEARRRAGLLLEKLVHGAADDGVQQQVARTVLLALDRYPRAADENDRAATARTTLSGVLARLAVRDGRLADELAARLLGDLQRDDRFGFHYGRGDALLGLGRLFPALAGERRAAALAALRAAIGDPRFEYMRTSGRRTPLRHQGHEGLALAAVALSRDEIAAVSAQAKAARATAAASGNAADDLAGIYDELEAALAQRERAIAR